MSKEARLAYTPPTGINVMFYGPNQTTLQIPEHECFATFYCPILDPNEETQKYVDDIDEELTKLKVLKDSVTIKDEPKLTQPHIEVHVLLDRVKDNTRYQKYLTQLDDKKKRMSRLSGTPVEDVTTVRL